MTRLDLNFEIFSKVWDIRCKRAGSAGMFFTVLNSEFQGIARRDKKGFLCEQCKEIEESNRMEKTRDLFKKIGDTKGTLHQDRHTKGQK